MNKFRSASPSFTYALLCSYVLMFSPLTPIPVDAVQNKLMVILLDGFRWDYLKNINNPNCGFDRVRKEGVQAGYSLPVFPSMSYPNYYSIMTGCYPDIHGIMLNNMYNPDTKETFDRKTSYWWEQAEPFWITAIKEGLRVLMYLWPGCEVEIKGVKPDSCIPYSFKLGTSEFVTHMDNAIKKFANNDGDVAIVYCEQPDFFGHVHGPESLPVKLIVQQLDEAIEGLKNNIEKHNLQDKVNVIIVSDHGMTKKMKILRLQNYISIDDIVTTVDTGAILGIYPVDGKLEKVYNDLLKMPNCRVWKKNEIPEEFHYNNIRTSPLVLLAEPGYVIEEFVTKSVTSNAPLPTSIINLFIAGYHGYDTKDFPDMRGIFLAFGPDFKSGAEIPPIQNQDVYNLMMKLCDLEPLPNNGTWANVAPSLKATVP